MRKERKKSVATVKANKRKNKKEKPLTILITNDDGINAPGLEALERIARGISEDVWVVAPELEQSGAGHSLTINMPLRYRQVSEKRFAVTGTPTDCVMMAVRHLLPVKVDLVLSGVNRGKNVGEDVTHSGTVAGALEGTLCDIPSIAFSQAVDFTRPNPKMHWKTAEALGPGIVRTLLENGFERDTLYNVNFPDRGLKSVKGIKMVAHGKRDIPKQLTRCVDPKGRPYYWLNWPEEGFDPRRPDSDIKWLSEGYVTITPLCMDLTHYGLLQRLKEKMEHAFA